MTPLAAYLQRRDANEAFNQESQAGELRQAGALQALLEKRREAQQDDALRADLAQSGGDLNSALQAAVSRGNLAGAAKLAPLIEARRRENATPADTRPEILRLQDAAAKFPDGHPLRAQINARITHLGQTSAEKTQPLSALGKLIAERDALPEGHPQRAIYDQAITKFQPGGITVNVAPNAPIIPGKPAQNKVDEGLLDAGMRMQQLTAIERQFRPEFQEIGAKWDAIKLSARDKSGLMPLDVGEKQRLTQFSQFKRNAIDAMNQYIKSVTGAAMTNAEAERILRGLPNTGTGLFDGDSPTEFKAKLDDTMRQVRMAEARLVYIKRNGLNLGDVELDRMPTLMNQRGAEIEGLVRKSNPKMPDDAMKKLVRRNLAQEFGLVE